MKKDNKNFSKIIVTTGTLFFVLPLFAVAYGDAYGQSTYYAQSPYYSQSTYYTESSYQTTFSNNASETKNFQVVGAISKGSGTFVIDHPLLYVSPDCSSVLMLI